MSAPQSSKFRVAIRLRLLLEKEQATCINCVNAENAVITVSDPIGIKHQRAGRQIDVIHRSREQKFAFDFLSQRESVEQIFRLCTRDKVDDSINGYKGCIFASGATGSSKTFTMMGNEWCLEEASADRAHLRAAAAGPRPRLQSHRVVRRD